MLEFLKKIFGGGPAKTESAAEKEKGRKTPARSREQRSRSAAGTSGASRNGDPVGFVRFVVENLVDSPDKVRIECVERGRESEIRIHCAKEDRGKVIGRSGKTIAAIRTLVAGAGGRMRKKYNVELVE